MPEPALTRPASTTAMMAQRTEPTFCFGVVPDTSWTAGGSMDGVAGADGPGVTDGVDVPGLVV